MNVTKKFLKIIIELIWYIGIFFSAVLIMSGVATVSINFGYGLFSVVLGAFIALPCILYYRKKKSKKHTLNN